MRERGEDGGRVRHGDHLPPHSYIRNTSTSGTAPIEHPLNTDRRPQTSKKAIESMNRLITNKAIESVIKKLSTKKAQDQMASWVNSPVL